MEFDHAAIHSFIQRLHETLSSNCWRSIRTNAWPQQVLCVFVYPNLSMYLVYARHHNPPQVPSNTCGSHHKREKVPECHCHRRKECANVTNLFLLSMNHRRHQKRMKHRRHQQRENKCNIRILCDGLVHSVTNIYLLSRCLCFRLKHIFPYSMMYFYRNFISFIVIIRINFYTMGEPISVRPIYLYEMDEYWTD